MLPPNPPPVIRLPCTPGTAHAVAARIEALGAFDRLDATDLRALAPAVNASIASLAFDGHHL